MTEYLNKGFAERGIGTQRTVTNSTGRDLKWGELVKINDFFGNVVNPQGIKIGERGQIDTATDRTIQTTYLESETFAIDDKVYLKEGSETAPATVTKTATGNSLIGVIVAVDNEQKWIEIQLY